jgi:hypothetical protein
MAMTAMENMTAVEGLRSLALPRRVFSLRREADDRLITAG